MSGSRYTPIRENLLREREGSTERRRRSRGTIRGEELRGVESSLY
jgi:hypothetical protein